MFRDARVLIRRLRRARKVVRVARKSALIGAGVCVGLGAAAWAARRMRRMDLLDKVVVITGGSRGLGLALAEECARQGSRVAICSRSRAELDSAAEQIKRQYATDILTEVCDVTSQAEVQSFLAAVVSRFGQIDVLINNAGIISVGPVESQTLNDYQEAMEVMYWGVVYPTLSVLPGMKGRRSGRVANIASIGGKIAVPHLVPYVAAKFAAVGFSEGLRAELLKDNIYITTVCPGLMRTGSHLNAYFKGQHRREFTWFSLGATMPFVSIDAHRAAKKILEAIRHGDAELIITPQAKLISAVHGMFPGFTVNLLGLVNRLLPAGDRQDRYSGRESETAFTRSFVERLGRNAAKELNQQPARQVGAGD